MTGPSYWPPQPPPGAPPVSPPQFAPPPFAPPGGPGAVAWAPGLAAAPPALPARSPVDVGAVLRLVAAGLLLLAGTLTAIACFLTVLTIDFGAGDPPFEATAWSDGGERLPTPIRWGIPMAVVAAALVAGGVLLLVSRWSASLRGTGTAVAAAAVGGVVAVGWMLGGYVSDLGDAIRGIGVDPDVATEVESGGATVLVVVALWTALAALVPLVLAPVLDAVRARAAVGGAR